MKTIIKTAIAALTLSIGTAAAQAHPIVHFPYKSAPYASSHTHSRDGYLVRSRSDCARTVIIRGTGKGMSTLVCPVK